MTLRFRPGEFYGALERASSGGAFDIRSLAASGCEHDVEVHTHEDAHFVLVLSGVYISTASGAPQYAPAPFLVFNPPGTTHRDRFVDGVGAFVAVSCEAQTLRGVAELQATSDVAVPLGHPGAIATAFRIAREVRGAGRDAGVLEGSAWELVSATGQGARPTTGPPPWAFAAYEAVMDCAADRRLSVAEVASATGVHPVHLARVFRQAWGCSPGDLLRWRRTELAARMLLDAVASAADVAAAAGFVDQSHMTRAFRAILGMTPGAWRRLHDVAPIQDRAVQAA